MRNLPETMYPINGEKECEEIACHSESFLKHLKDTTEDQMVEVPTFKPIPLRFDNRLRDSELSPLFSKISRQIEEKRKEIAKEQSEREQRIIAGWQKLWNHLAHFNRPKVVAGV